MKQQNSVPIRYKKWMEIKSIDIIFHYRVQNYDELPNFMKVKYTKIFLHAKLINLPLKNAYCLFVCLGFLWGFL